MKVVFSGYHNPNFITITEYIERAFRDQGHELVSFDDRSFLIPGRIRQRSKILRDWDLNRLNDNLISLVLKNKPDLCIVTGGHRILPDTVKKIKNIGVIPVLWTIDFPLDFDPIIKAAPFYDHIFCGGTEAQVLLKQAGIKKTYWLPFACDPDQHKPLELGREDKDNYKNDIVFVGSHYPNREETLKQIIDFDLGVWGPGWRELTKDENLRKAIRGGMVKPCEWVKIFNTAKIIIIIHYKDGKVLDYQASPKVYEALSCKGFALVNDQRDVLSLFEDGKHLVIFKDTKDLRQKIDYYLNDPEKRKEIAQNGYNYVLANHTYSHRIKRMLSVIKETDGKS